MDRAHCRTTVQNSKFGVVFVSDRKADRCADGASERRTPHGKGGRGGGKIRAHGGIKPKIRGRIGGIRQFGNDGARGRTVSFLIPKSQKLRKHLNSTRF